MDKADACMVDVYSQDDVDRMFADMDSLLALERPPPVARDGRLCIDCGSDDLRVEGSNSGWPGCVVCDQCGVVQSTCVYWEYFHYGIPTHRTSNYKRIHHFHERISQLLLMESEIPPDKMLLIGEKLCDGTHPVINKDVVRGVLRSLNMQLYIEKYLQIIHRVTGIEPPVPGPQLLMALDHLFTELQRPFDTCRPAGRRNFLNYNYVFCRLFQRLGCEKFCMFFPLIKSKQKLKALDETYGRMCEMLNWPLTPLQQVAPFSVRLESPETQLADLRAQCARRSQAALGTEPWKKGYRKSDLRIVADLQRERWPRRSIPPERMSQTLELAPKRRRTATA